MAWLADHLQGPSIHRSNYGNRIHCRGRDSLELLKLESLKPLPATF
jgi:hypothetical protein